MDRHGLAEDNLGLAYFFARKYAPYFPSLELEDAVGHAMIGLWDACLGFDPAKGKLSTYAGRLIWSELEKATREHRRANYHRAAFCSIDGMRRTQTDDADAFSFLDLLAAEGDPEEEAVTRVHAAAVLRRMSARDVRLVVALSQGMDQRRAGKRVGVSQAQASRVRAKFLREMAG